jgi:hypothetical protein
MYSPCRWVQEQQSSAPASLWTQASKEYCQYVDEILHEFKDTIQAIQSAKLNNFLRGIVQSTFKMPSALHRIATTPGEAIDMTRLLSK